MQGLRLKGVEGNQASGVNNDTPSAARRRSQGEAR
jgi:hypothetical protein